MGGASLCKPAREVTTQVTHPGAQRVPFVPVTGIETLDVVLVVEINVLTLIFICRLVFGLSQNKMRADWTSSVKSEREILCCVLLGAGGRLWISSPEISPSLGRLCSQRHFRVTSSRSCEMEDETLKCD